MSFFRYGPKMGGLAMPFRELERMRDHMETIYNSLASGVSQIRKNYTGVFPLVNLAEDEEKLYFTAELPGAAPDKLEVSVKGDTLSIRGQIGPDEAGEGVDYHRRERESGNFRRTLTLPAKVDVDKVDAVFKNGVLTVTIPKAAEAKAHQISIKTD